VIKLKKSNSGAKSLQEEGVNETDVKQNKSLNNEFVGAIVRPII
jgi:hypothetical protein